MMRLCLIVCISWLAGLQVVSAANVLFGHEDESQNLLNDRNWDLEDAISKSNWRTRWGKATTVDDAYTGSKALLIYKRTKTNGGAYIRVTGLKPSTAYYFSMFIKQTTGRKDGKDYSLIRMLGRHKVNGKYTNFNLAQLPYMRPDGDWKQAGGDFVTPDTVADSFDFWVRADPVDIEYIQDTAALTEIPAPVDFKAETDAKIDQLRKTDITVTGSVPAGSEVQIELARHQFGFGTAIKAKPFVGTNPLYTNYRNFVLNNFNWVVFENDMKWRPMEKRKGAVKFSVVDRAMKVLQENNMKVRGHAITWDIMESNPNWAAKETGKVLNKDVFRRLGYMVEHYKGQINEWDVCNEYLHQHFFEAKTGLVDMIEEQFNAVANLDNTTKLFLNDYEITRNGQYTSAQADLARYLLGRGVPCHGVGIQSHLRTLPVPPEVLAKRVQIAGSAGLPITITELSVHSYDMDVRTKAVDEAFRVYFADENVHAIILWGFSDQLGVFADDFFLTTGRDFTLTQAGHAMMDLFKQWHTKEVIDASGGTVDGNFRGFYGDYTIKIVTDGEVTDTQTFTVTKEGPNTISL